MADGGARRSWIRRNGLTLVLLGAAAAVWFGGKELRRPHAPPPINSAVPATAYADDGTPVAPVLGEPTSGPRLVEFYTDECSACRAMRPTVERLRGEAPTEGYELLLINLSERRNEHLAARFQLRGVPTFALIGADGTETGRFEGVVGLRPLRRAASALVGAH
jgi:thiol-disulfide isomerase/thioredoxin